MVDWLRGFATILMMMAHTYDSWMNPAARHGFAYGVVRHLSGLPSRLFLFLVGVAAAIGFENQIARGVSPADMRRRTIKRGLQIIVAAYLFRFQEYAFSGFWGGWSPLLRVDILNCIGASLLLVALVGVPRNGRPRYFQALLGATILVAFGPLIGPRGLSSLIPAPLGSYIGGPRPMSWFPLFPWGAWTLAGLVIGHLWLRHGRTPAEQNRTFAITGAVGAILVLGVFGVRAINPYIIRYPSDLVQQMGPGSFILRLGSVGVLALIGHLVVRLSRTRYSPTRQIGQTSLLIYWVHVELVYGYGTRPIQGQLSFGETTLAFLLLCLVMFGLSVWKTRHGPAVIRWIRSRLGRNVSPKGLSLG